MNGLLQSPWRLLPLVAAAAALAYLLPLAVFRLFPRRLSRDSVFRYGVGRRAARMISGVVVYLALAAPLAIFTADKPIRPLLWAGAGLLALGLVDDLRTLPLWVKVLGVAAAAGWATRHGVVVDLVKLPLSTRGLALGWWSYPATVAWLIVVTGAIVVTRRLQGLTLGLTGLASGTLALAALAAGTSTAPTAVAGALALAAVSFGYLRYDFPPPRLPLGSSAYYSLGFVLAGISVIGALKNTAFLIILLPLLAFAIPVLDTTYAFIYGSRAGGRALTLGPRREFLHQALLRDGLSPRRAVAFFYAVSAYLCLVALLLVGLMTVSFVVKMALLAVLLLLGLAGFYCVARIIASPQRRPAPDSIVDLLSVPVHQTDMAGALQKVEQFVSEHSPHMVVTSDTSAVVRAQRDAELHDILLHADLVTPDGMGVVWAAKVLGLPLWERVSGIDLMQHICELAAAKGYSIYLLGAAPGVADAAAEELKARHPGLTICAAQHGYFSAAEEPGIVRAIAACKPDILFVAMGIPKQEKWIRRHLGELGVSVAIGVGGSFDVIAGRVRRAPPWMRSAGLEWLYRTAREPRRIPRLLAIPRLVWMALREAVAARRKGV